MKARNIINRANRPIRYEQSGGMPRYYAYSDSIGVLPGHTLVFEGKIEPGDYFQSKGTIHTERWEQALGVVGSLVKNYRVSRPIQK